MPIAHITFKEGMRNRSFYGISLVALTLQLAMFVIAPMAPRDVGKVAVEISLSVVSLAGLLLVLFVGINLLAKDLDRRTIYMVLARPVSRTQYILGKFFGMASLIAVTMFMIGMIALTSIAMLKWSYPNYFDRFSWSLLFLALVYKMLMLILLSSLSFFFSSFASTSFITLVLTAMTYIIGSSLSDVKNLVDAPGTGGIHVSSFIAQLVNGAYYIFPNLSFFDLKMQAAHGLPVSSVFIALSSTYCVIYIAIAIVAASIIFSKKEFP